jgi:hypothetical protein
MSVPPDGNAAPIEHDPATEGGEPASDQKNQALLKPSKQPAIAKTRLELNVDPSSEAEQSSLHADPATAVGSPSIDGNAQTARAQTSTAASKAPISPFQRIVMKLDPVVAKTKLDVEACKEVVKRVASGQEVKFHEIREQLAQKPAKYIENYKKASACSTQWDDMTGTDEFRLCQKCKLYVYDFKDMNYEEACLSVFKREAKSEVQLWKRSDSKFLTVDCPEGVKQKRTKVLMWAGSVLAFIVIVALFMLMPPPKPTTAISEPAPSAAEDTQQDKVVNKALDKQAGSASSLPASGTPEGWDQPIDSAVEKTANDRALEESSAAQQYSNTSDEPPIYLPPGGTDSSFAPPDAPQSLPSNTPANAPTPTTSAPQSPQSSESSQGNTSSMQPQPSEPSSYRPPGVYYAPVDGASSSK